MTELTGIAHQIWDMKYRLKDEDGRPVDNRVEDTWRRVATAVAEAESPDQRALWAERFYDAMADFRFLPAGRVLAGAGSGRRVTLFNCFVMGRIEDDLSAIFDQLREAALTMQQGGGIGHDFSTLRPKGAPVKGVGADASGPASFMDVWDSMCRTIMSAGARRGAMMATMRCDHPDIEAFVDAKRDPARLRMFNLSVLVTDAFMDAVRADGPWDLQFDGKIYRTVRARDLWDRIMRATYDVAEPGVIFIDRINTANNLAYCETISATNPCGEQPLPPYGACLLGSVNLARLVRDPFSPRARLDEETLEALTRTAVRFLDNVIDISGYPLEAQAAEARGKRRIGLGVTGLADALLMTGVRYGSPEAQDLAARWLARMERAAYLASTDLAAEKGPFPLFDRDAYLAGQTVRGLDADVRAAIETSGMRNGLLTSIAPTGTISLFAGNVSSGIEPVFSFSARRRVLMPDGEAREEIVEDYAYRLFRERHGAGAALPDAFVSAMELAPEAHVAMQSVAQAHIDSSISKTINVPEDISFDAFKSVYALAYEQGCKGCTTYRPNPVTGAVLSAADTQESADGEGAGATGKDAPDTDRRTAASSDGGVHYMTQPLDRPPVLPGNTYKVRWPQSDHAIYITVNDIEQDGRRRPFEIFINSKNMEHFAWTVALTRMISAVFRRGGDVSFVVEELKAVFDPRGGAWVGGRYVPSILAAIGNAIEEHMVDIGFLPPQSGRGRFAPDTDDIEIPKAEAVGASGAADTPANVGAGPVRGKSCPRCGQPALIPSEGCETCLACGFSHCS